MIRLSGSGRVTCFDIRNRMTFCQGNETEDGGVMKTKEELYFEQFYRDTKSAVEHYLKVLLHNYSVIEDVSQEVYLEAYRKLDVLMQHPEPRGFLFRMARFKALHWLREKYRIEQSEVLCEDSVLVMQVSDEDEYRSLEMLMMVEQVLTEDEFSIFEAHYLKGYTEKEIAVTKNKSHGAIRMSCSRMTRKLREKMIKGDGWAS